MGLFFKSEKTLRQVHLNNFILQMKDMRPRGATEFVGGRMKMGVPVLVHPSIRPWQRESNQRVQAI